MGIYINGRLQSSGGGGPSGPHAATHEDGGADEIDVTGLSGLLADPQDSLSTDALLFGANSVSATTTTRYLWPSYDDSLCPTSPVQYRAPRAGTLQKLYVKHNTPAGNGNAIVYTLRINGVASALTVSLASTAADGSDLVNTVAVAAGDLLDIEVTKAASVGSTPQNIVASLEFAA